MVKYNKEGKLVAVLDNIMRFGSLNKASDASGINAWTLSRWRRKSEDGDEQFQEVDYRGLIQPFHMHVEDAIEQSIDEIESILRTSARDGQMKPTINKGQYSYEDDEYAISMTEKEFNDALDLGLVWPDKKKRVLNPATGIWERVKVMEWSPPSVEAQALVLRSWSDRYADRRSLNINGNMNMNFVPGVTVMGGPPRVEPPPKQLEVFAQAEAITGDTEPMADGEYFEIDDDQQPDEVPVEQQPVEQQPEPIASEPSFLDAEQQEIIKRLRSQNPLGRGSPPNGDVKVA